MADSMPGSPSTVTPTTGGRLAAPSTGRRSVVRNLASLMFSQSVTWVLATVVSIIQPRYLGPAAQGQLRLAVSVWLIAQVVIAVGTTSHVTLEFARRDAEAGVLLGPVTMLRLVAAAASTLLVALYLVVTGAESEVVRIFALIGAGSVLIGVTGAARAALIGLERMSYVAIADVASKLAYTLLVLVVLVGGGGATGVAVVFAVANAVTAALLVHYARRLPGVVLRPRFDGMRRALALSAGFFAAEVILVVYQQVDTVVMSALVSKDELGWYAASDTLFTSVLFVPTILMTALLPLVGRLHVEDPGRLKRLVEQTFSSLLLLGVPLGLGTLVIAAPLCRLLYGRAFAPAGDVLGVMGLVVICVFATILFGQVAVATGRQRLWNVTMGIAIAISIPIDLALVPWAHRVHGNGAIAGAIAYLVTEGFMLVVGLVKIAPYLLRREVLVRSLKVLSAGGLMAAAAWPWRDRPIVVPVAVAVAVYVAFVAASGALTDDERARVAAFADRLHR